MRSPPRFPRVLAAICVGVLPAACGWSQSAKKPEGGQTPATTQAATVRDGAAWLVLVRADLAVGRVSEARAKLDEGLAQHPEDVGLRLATVDLLLASDQPASALKRARMLDGPPDARPALQFRMSRAYHALGRIVGKARVESVHGGRAGQFVGQRLLVEPRPGADCFLCCPPASALYQLRQALDAGFDEPAAHVLHARIWQELGKPQVGYSLLRGRAAALLSDPTPQVLAAFSDLALASDDLGGYLRYERLRAAQRPERRDEILGAAYLAAAERHNLRGNETLYIEWLRRALAHRGNDAALLVRLADAEWDAGRHEQAWPLYRRALRVDPNHARRAEILLRLGAGVMPARED